MTVDRKRLQEQFDTLVTWEEKFTKNYQRVVDAIDELVSAPTVRWCTKHNAPANHAQTPDTCKLSTIAAVLVEGGTP